MARVAPSLSQAAHFSSLPAVANTLWPRAAQHLDRRRADAAGAAMDQHASRRLEPRAVHQIGPDGEKHFGQGRRIDQVDTPSGTGSTHKADATAYSA